MQKERLVLVVCVCLLSINLHLFGQLSTGALWSVEKNDNKRRIDNDAIVW